MIDNDAYDDFVAMSPQGSIFCTSWWLDAVAPGHHGYAVVTKDGRIDTAWPYVVRRAFGRTLIDMPPLTPWLGVLLGPTGGGKLSTRLGEGKGYNDGAGVGASGVRYSTRTMPQGFHVLGPSHIGRIQSDHAIHIRAVGP